MANFSQLKAAIAQIIKPNGNNEITGQLLQNNLFSMLNEFTFGSIYGGVAIPTTAPGNPDGNLFYLAVQIGIYSNFNGYNHTGGLVIFVNRTGTWIATKFDFADSADITFLYQAIGDLSSQIIAIQNELIFSADYKFIENITIGLTNGYFIQPFTGQLLTNSDWHSSDFIAVTPGDFIRISGTFAYNATAPSGNGGVAGYSVNTLTSYVTSIFDLTMIGRTISGRFKVQDFVTRIPQGVNYIRGSSAFQNTQGNESILKIEKVSPTNVITLKDIIANHNTSLKNIKDELIFDTEIIFQADITGVMTNGGHIDVNNGKYFSNVDYQYTGYIPVIEGQHLRISGVFGYNPTIANYTAGIAGYSGASESLFVKNLFDPGNVGETVAGRYLIIDFIIQIPAGINYVRGSSAFQNTSSTSYPYKNLLIELVTLGEEITLRNQISKLTDLVSIIQNELVFEGNISVEADITGTLTNGSYIQPLTGVLVASADYHYSGFIPVTPGREVRISGCFGWNPNQINIAGVAGYSTANQSNFVTTVFDPFMALPHLTTSGRFRIENFIVTIPIGVNYIRGSSAFQNASGQERPLLIELMDVGFVEQITVKQKIHQINNRVSTLETLPVGSGGDIRNFKRIYSNGKFVNIYDPYARGMLNPLVGQLHVHTTNSDGSYSPSVVASKMKSAGYDFWTITDHNVVTPNPEINDLIWLCDSYEDTRSTFHANVFNTQTVYVPADLNALLDRFLINGTGIIMLNHPDWSSLFLTEQFLKTINLKLGFVEVFNLTGTTNSERGLDILLSNGHRIWSTATDDYHNDTELKKGWVVAFSQSKRPNDIMYALLTGSFVASSGMMITSVSLKANYISVDTGDPQATTVFYKENMTILATITGAIAEYGIQGDEMFIRAVVTNLAGKKCWIQPYFIFGKENPIIVGDD